MLQIICYIIALSDKDTVLSEKDEKILKLENELLWLRRKVFGSTSERFIPADPNVRQLELFGDELTEEERKALNEEAAKQEELIIKTIKVKKDRTPRKDPSWDNLRVEEIILEPAEKDDERYTLIGEDSSDKLAFIPGEIYIKRSIHKKYALKKTIAESAEAEFLAPVVMSSFTMTMAPDHIKQQEYCCETSMEQFSQMAIVLTHNSKI